MPKFENTPERLSDFAHQHTDVRIVCRKCGFEEDWRPDVLASHLTEIGGSDIWSEITRHLRCRSFGCGSTDLCAVLVPQDGCPANMRRRIGRLDAHLLSAALGVLEAVASRSRGQAAATLEVRLALLVVHRYARDHEAVRCFWSRASAANRTADEGLAEPLQVIRHRLVTAGWLAPSFLVEPVRTWPWDSPPPPGWFHPCPSSDSGERQN